jgi:predicted ferric reductase
MSSGPCPFWRQTAPHRLRHTFNASDQLTVAIFPADRILKGIMLLLSKRQQTATLTPLVGGGTMIELSRPVSRAVAGKHALLMINKFKSLQTHPHTIASTNPVQFTVDAHSGFPKKLYERALREPGFALKAAVDGPFGTFTCIPQV